MLCPPPVPRLVSEDGDWEGLCVPLQTGHGPGLAPRTARCLSPAVGTPRWPGSQQVVPAAVCSPAPVLPVVWGHCARLWRCVGSDHCAPGWTVIWGGTIDCEVVCVGVPCSEQSLGLARPSTCLKLIPPAQTRFLGFCILGMCFPLVPNGPQASLGNRLWTRMSLGPHGVFSELQWPAEESRRSSPLFLDLSPPPPFFLSCSLFPGALKGSIRALSLATGICYCHLEWPSDLQGAWVTSGVTSPTLSLVLPCWSGMGASTTCGAWWDVPEGSGGKARLQARTPLLLTMSGAPRYCLHPTVHLLVQAPADPCLLAAQECPAVPCCPPAPPQPGPELMATCAGLCTA